MGHLKALKAVTVFRLLAHNIKHRVYQLSTFRVVTLGPIVASPRLAKHKVVWAKQLPKGTSLDRVHCARLQVNKDGARNVLAARRFVVVHIDALQLKVRVSTVGSRWVDTMLI